MRKVLFFAVCFLMALHCLAQQNTIISLKQSNGVRLIDDGRTAVLKPIFTHEGSTLAADSAVLDEKGNAFDAYGNVVITQSDGTVIRSDLLNYNGNTRIALLTRSVRMTDKGGAVLTTELLSYNMGTKIGTYTNGGKIVNGEDVLTSKNGYYFASSRDAYFRYNVVTTTKDAVVKSDTMRYNTGTKTAYFYGPTHIYGKKDTLYTELGDYNTVSRQSNGFKNNLYQQATRTFIGDTISFDDKKGIGKANGNITFNDTEQKVAIMGDVGVYTRSDSSIMVTKNAYIIMVTQDSAKTDSVWIGADTISSKVIPLKQLVRVEKPQLKKNSELDVPDEPGAADNLPLAPPVAITDSVKIVSKNTVQQSLVSDTSKTRIVNLYHNVKIFKSNLQARADSVFYSYADSILRCYNNPIAWSQGSQFFADTMLLQLKNKKLDNMILQHNGYVLDIGADSTKLNQIKGKNLFAGFKNDQLNSMIVDGNAESIYYFKEDTVYRAMNRTLSSRITMQFRNNELQTVTLIKFPSGHSYPISSTPEDVKILQGAIWKSKERPKSKEEIIPKGKIKPKAAIPVPAKKPNVQPATDKKK